MRPQLISLLALALSLTACDRVAPCKPDTLLLYYRLGGLQGVVDQLRVAVTVDGKTTTTTATLPSSADGSVEIDFPSGYPVGYPCDVTVTAFTAGDPIGVAVVTLTIAPACSTVLGTLRPVAPDTMPDLSVTPPRDLSATPPPDLNATPLPDLRATPLPDLSATPLPDLSVSVTRMPDLSVTPTCSSPTETGDGGVVAEFVFDTITLPQQRADFAFDLVGSGRPTNQFGTIIEALAQQNLDSQATVNQALYSGQEVMLLAGESVDPMFVMDPCAIAGVLIGEPVSMPPTSGATYVVAMNARSGFFGPILHGRFDSAAPATTTMPVTLAIKLPLLAGAPLQVINLYGAHLMFTYYAGGQIMGGQINGGIKQSDVDKILIPTLAQSLENHILADQGHLTSTDTSLLALFDNGGIQGPMQPGCAMSCAGVCQNPANGTNACGCATSGDGVIDLCEVSTNSIVKSLFSSDIQLFDATGNYAPNPNPTHLDSLSFGIGFTGIPARF